MPRKNRFGQAQVDVEPPRFIEIRVLGELGIPMILGNWKKFSVE